MDSGESSLFWDFLINFLCPLFCLLITFWYDRGYLDEPETSYTHDTKRPNEPILSSNTCKAASCFFCHKSIPAGSPRNDFAKIYLDRKLIHCGKRWVLSRYGLEDRYLRSSYRNCREATSIQQEVHIEKNPGTGASLNGYFGYEPDLNAIAAKTPHKLFNSSTSVSALKSSFMGSHSYKSFGYEPDLSVLEARAPRNLFNSAIYKSEWKISLNKTVPTSVRHSNYMNKNYSWLGEHILLLGACINLSRPEMRELLRETDEKLRPSWNSDPRALLPELMVIDCFSRRVVTAQPGCDYVALSYVWGSNRSRDAESFQPDLGGRRLPQTVQDAMNVVRVLGMQFLWVDRYCINSVEPVTKHYMISNMDAIYEAAYLTIIAASGSDDEHGLPSVSRSCEALEGGDVPPWAGIVCTGFSPHSEQIEQSAWSTRGWTYQEGLLSRRRLIFGDDCAIIQYRGDDQVNVNSGIFFHINEYSKRSLTYPSDLLNAFLGVLRAYERLRPPAMHIWGVPFLLDSDGNIGQPGYGLLWRSNLRNSLCRIQGLPSWTWAGWNGWSAREAADRSLYEPGPYRWLLRKARLRRKTQPWGPSDISLEILAGGHLINISDHFRAGHRLPFCSSGEAAPSLYLTAWSTTVTGYVLPRFSVYLEGGDMASARATFDGRVESFCKPESQVNRCWSCEWTAAVICWNVSNKRDVRSRQTQSLLLERVGEDTFRRVGILETDWQKSDMDGDGHMVAFGRTFTRTRLRIV